MRIGDTINGKKVSSLFGGQPVIDVSSNEIAVGDRVIIMGRAATIAKIRKPSATRIVVDFTELGFGMWFMRKKPWQKIEANDAQ